MGLNATEVSTEALFCVNTGLLKSTFISEVGLAFSLLFCYWGCFSSGAITTLDAFYLAADFPRVCLVSIEYTLKNLINQNSSVLK